jgi:hypothetical protein
MRIYRKSALAPPRVHDQNVPALALVRTHRYATNRSTPVNTLILHATDYQ